MQDGNYLPFITEKSVREALDSLIYTTTGKSAPIALQALTAVDAFLVATPFPGSDRARELAVQHILIDLITENYFDIRQKLDLLPLEHEAISSIAIARQAISEDIGANSAELSAWAWLYYRYVCVDIGMSPEDYSNIVHLDPRTLRRYQQHAIKRLTEQLIHLERHARNEHRLRLLFAELPALPEPFINDERLLNKLDRRLSENWLQRLLFTGNAGVGKTVFVSALVRRLIDRKSLDHVIWINNIKTVNDVYRQLHERLLPPNAKLFIGEVLQILDVCIVIDDADPLFEDLPSLEQLLWDLKHSFVCLISVYSQQIKNIDGHFLIGELQESESKQLARRLLELRNYPETEIDNLVSIVWRSVGGNPLAIHLALANILMGQGELASANALQKLFMDSFHSLDEAERFTLYILTLMDDEYPLSEFTPIWPFVRNGLNGLLHRHLVEGNPTHLSRFLVTHSVQQFVFTQYALNHAVKDDFSRLFDMIDQLDQHRMRYGVVLRFVETILLKHSEMLHHELLLKWIKQFWKVGVHGGSLHSWRLIFEHHSELMTEDRTDHVVLLGYATCLRRFGEWDEALLNLERLIQDTGEVGDFECQAYALLEQAKIRRNQGAYRQASEILNAVQAYAIRTHHKELSQLVPLEIAQIEIDRGNSQQVLHYLHNSETLRARLLRCEAYALQNNIRVCHQTADEILSAIRDDHTRGVVYTILGRAYEKTDPEAALEFFMAALQFFNRSGDMFSSARAQTNAGALMIQKGEYKAAKSILEKAHQVQSILRDRIGLQSSRHNLQVVNSRLV